MSLKSCYLPGFLKLGYSKKIIKDNTVWFILSFHKIFSNLQKVIQSDPCCPLKDPVWPILYSQGSFLNFHQKLVFYFCFKHLLKNLNWVIWVDPYCRFRKIRSTFIKNIVQCWIFFNISNNIWLRDNTVWHLLSFQGSHILSFQGSNKSCNLKPIYFWFLGGHALLYVTFSIRPSVVHHIPGTIHHLIIILGTHK